MDYPRHGERLQGCAPRLAPPVRRAGSGRGNRRPRGARLDRTRSRVDIEENNQDTAPAGDISTEESGNNTIAGGKVTAVFGFLWKIILIAAAILFVIIFIVRCAKKKKRVDNMLESSDVTALFNSLENLLARCGYNRFNMDYEEYAEVLEESDDIFRINNIKMIIDYVLMVNYRKNDGIDNDNNEYVCSQIRKLRESLFAKMNPLRRFVLKYIICM